MMKIYTRTGDDGTTGLFAGGRVSKAAARVEAYGTVDELNCHIGMALAASPDPTLRDMLTAIQNDLFVVGADLATPRREGGDVASAQRLPNDRAVVLEEFIDRLEEDLPPLRAFILPGGAAVGAHLHLARTVCRRAERRVVAAQEEAQSSPAIVEYLNRLSDLLFVAARWANQVDAVPEVEWTPGT
jgi:cob(I)alamin adenosyltransferase